MCTPISLFPLLSCLSFPVWRALVQVWPRDPATYAIDMQFMLGDALMGIPILEQGAGSVDGYLPNEVRNNTRTTPAAMPLVGRTR